MRVVVLTLLLVGCASNGSGQHLMVSDSYHGPIIWHKFQTAAACEGAKKGSAPEIELRCTTKSELKAQYDR